MHYYKYMLGDRLLVEGVAAHFDKSPRVGDTFKSGKMNIRNTWRVSLVEPRGDGTSVITVDLIDGPVPKPVVNPFADSGF